MKKSNQLIAAIAVAFAMSLVSPSVEARPRYIESGSYADSNGCIHIVYKVEHRFLGINWYTTTQDVTVVC
ncbi:MAG: hypothetical protein IM631_12460 [Cytophagales bacterium]|nr:hypothetical protein [Cytophagales bacterium]MCA6382327.1 hypothetical protein [Cytophagales bacterium]